MVSQHAPNDTSSPRHPDWPSLFEKDVRKDPRFIDLDFAGPQSWDPLTSHASQAPSAKRIPDKAAYPSELLGPGNQRSYVSDASGPSSTTRRLCTALQGPPCAECGVSTKGSLPAVQNPAGAPLFDRLSAASRSLLSPIELESLPNQDIPGIRNQDSGIHVSSPYCDGEFQTNGRLIPATSKSLIHTFDDPQADCNAVDCTEKTPRPPALQDGKPSTFSLHGGTRSPQSETIQLERLDHEKQESLVQRKRTRATEFRPLGENPVIPIEGDPFLSDNSNRSTDAEEGSNRRAHQASLGYLPPYYGTPESPIKNLEQGGCVEEAHFTTVTSPSRPQIVTILRRGSSVDPASHIDSPRPSSQPKQDYHITTPPEALTATPKTSWRIDEPDETEEIKRITEVAKANPRPPITPPNSPVENRATSEKVAYLDLIPRDSIRAIYRVKRYQPVAWILDELEFMVGNFPSTMLQLDSPVIQHVRRELMTATRSSSAVPKPTLHSGPHSRYSTRHQDGACRSFSSHSLSHSCTEGFHGAEVCCLCPPSLGSPSSIPSFTGTSPTSSTLYALRKVFPHAPSHTLDCIQATSFALAYVSSVCISHDVPLSVPPVLVHSCCAGTSTTQEKLGPRVHSEPPHSGTTWLRPQTPECLDVEISAERLESLAVSLNELFRELLGEINGRRLGTGNDALARAVQELIRLGEKEGDREEVRAGAGV